MRWAAFSLLGLVTAGCVAEPAGEAPVATEQPLLGGALCDVLGNCRAARAEDWATGAPEDHDLDAARLDAATSFAAANDARCLLVVRDGALVYERYANGADARSLHDTWSIAKTFTSALVGAAIQNGQIASVEDPASKYIPEWRNDAHAQIRLRHLLSGVSGLRYAPTLGLPIDAGDYSWLYTNLDLDDAAVHHPVGTPPGAEWRYNNHAVQVLGRILHVATRENADDYARRVLWGPLGMALGPASDRTSGTHWRRDLTDHPVMFSSVFATCRGLAKLGQLLLQRGEWGGRRLLDAAYVDQMLAPSQDKNRAYGFLTWLNHGPPAIGNTHNDFGGAPFPNAPADLVSAQGVGQNFIDVIPSRRTVIVHMRPPKLLDVRELLSDGKQELHREVLDRVLVADRRR